MAPYKDRTMRRAYGPRSLSSLKTQCKNAIMPAQNLPLQTLDDLGIGYVRVFHSNGVLPVQPLLQKVDVRKRGGYGIIIRAGARAIKVVGIDSSKGDGDAGIVEIRCAQAVRALAPYTPVFMADTHTGFLKCEQQLAEAVPIPPGSSSIDHFAFVDMQWIDSTLASYVPQRPSDVKKILLFLFHGIAVANAAINFEHRDIREDNILMQQAQADACTIRLVFEGLAWDVDVTDTPIPIIVDFSTASVATDAIDTVDYLRGSVVDTSVCIGETPPAPVHDSDLEYVV